MPREDETNLRPEVVGFLIASLTESEVVLSGGVRSVTEEQDFRMQLQRSIGTPACGEADARLREWDALRGPDEFEGLAVVAGRAAVQDYRGGVRSVAEEEDFRMELQRSI